MPSEQQLERSVLERKEREELRAIAQAMSLPTTSRSKKADIIDLILRAAGVEVAEVTPAKANGSAEGRKVRKSPASTSETATNAESGSGSGLGTDIEPPSAGPAASNGSSASSVTSSSSSNGSGAEHSADDR